jgi:hypothetical protein
MNTITPTLNDAWLSGITDAEGCFTCSILSNSNCFRFRYILTQKWEVNSTVLEDIKILFNEILAKGSVVPHFEENVWELRINGIKNCQNLFNYFDTFVLKTIKNNSYLKWKLLHKRLIKGDHLNKNLRLELLKLSKKINNKIK